MKGIQGLIVAVVLGIVGAGANFYYLNVEASKRDMVPFIGIKKGKIVGRGDKLSDDNMVKIEIPANLVGNLKDFACQWAEYDYLKGKQVWRTLDSSDTEGGLLLMRGDYREPPKDLELGKGERFVGVPVPKSFTTSLVNPGDRVSFRFMKMLPPPGLTPAVKSPTPAPTAAAGPAASVTAGTEALQPKPEEGEAAPQPSGPAEEIGPFIIVSIGNRLDRAEVMKVAKITPTQENVLNLRMSNNVPGEKERVEKLLNFIHTAGPNSYDVIVDGKQ
jgi:hypothetical protein